MPNETERLEALKEYGIMDSLPEADYDTITELAAQICGTPISLISLLDDKRQWFKSVQGLEIKETPKEQAFCAHTIQNPKELFVVPDSRRDERFSKNPLVTGTPNIVFYAGMPLVDDYGYALGSLCVIDSKEHLLTDAQTDSLKKLAKLVMSLIQLKKKNRALKNLLTSLEQENKALQEEAERQKL